MIETFDKFTSNEKGSSELDDIVNLAIALILVATLGVSAWQLLGNANMSGIDTTTQMMIQTVIGIVAAIAIVLILLRMAKSGK